MNIVGISAHYHESACCLLRNGALVAAAAEERFTRSKFDARVPLNAFRYCLATAGLHPGEIDAVAYYEDPVLKHERQDAMGLGHRADSHRPERELRRLLGFEGRILYYPHHLSHAAASYYFSGFEDASILTVDGVGEWATTSYAQARGGKIELLEEVRFPHSLGLLYSTITEFLGFEALSDEYKVMGLAPYGNPNFVEQLRKLLQLETEGTFRLLPEYFSFNSTDWDQNLSTLFGVPRREPGAELQQAHMDIARSLQLVLEETLLSLTRYLHTIAPSENLCLGGGVALNCVAVGRLRREGPFANVFVPPSPGDAGSSLGAATLACLELTGTFPAKELKSALLGPSFSKAECAAVLRGAGVPWREFQGDFSVLAEAIAAELAAGKIIGWFQGRMEFGPRALGARSILADPRDPAMRERLNSLVKKRELFRPFAPVVLESAAERFFDVRGPLRFMTETVAVRSSVPLPAVTHVDGSARVQTVSQTEDPRLAALLEAFGALTGVPVLVNTSFNVAGEPIVCTPADALRCAAEAKLDFLVLGDLVVAREEIPAFLRHSAARPAPAQWRASEGVYTFV